MSNIKQKEITIRPGYRTKHYLQEIWQYRELVAFLSWRDILVRYKQTVIGFAWSLIRPFLTMVVFTIIFGKLAKFSSEGVPYPIMVFAALLPWQLFANSLSFSSKSLLSNRNLITKVYFPRLIIPASTVMVSLVDFLISLCFLVLIMKWYQFLPTWRILTIPLFLFLAVGIALGVGIGMSALNAKYRDVQYVVPFIIQSGLYLSPVGFSSTVVPERWRLIYSLNPMVGVIDGFRWAILGGQSQIYWPGFVISVFLTVGTLMFSFFYFRKTENTIADLI